MTKAEGDHCKLPLKTTDEDAEEMEEATVSLAAAKEIRVYAAVAAVLSELDGIFLLIVICLVIALTRQNVLFFHTISP